MSETMHLWINSIIFLILLNNSKCETEKPSPPKSSYTDRFYICDETGAKEKLMATQCNENKYVKDNSTQSICCSFVHSRCAAFETIESECDISDAVLFKNHSQSSQNSDIQNYCVRNGLSATQKVCAPLQTGKPSEDCGEYNFVRCDSFGEIKDNSKTRTRKPRTSMKPEAESAPNEPLDSTTPRSMSTSVLVNVLALWLITLISAIVF